ncbi:MAG: CIA30 family protein [Chlorobiaceae bacterium]|nr:CIA30 family protein [Chlorobiaceae bacterium]
MGIERIVCDFSGSCLVWRNVDDVVMGGMSRSAMQLLEDGGAIFTGVLSLERNGGFASVRSIPYAHDYQDCDRFLIRVMGDGRKYSFRVRNDERFDGVVYASDFETVAGEWVVVEVPFAGFKPLFRGKVVSGAPPMDHGNVVQIGFLVASKQEGPFSLRIDWIKAVAE